MKNFHYILFFIGALLFTSCVNKIDIPEEEESKIFITVEMLRGKQIVASLSTSNNLNGTSPILFPEDAVVQLWESTNFENVIYLEYDEVSGNYVSPSFINTSNFIYPGKTYELRARINNSAIEEISSRVMVPNFGKVEDIEVTSLDPYIGAENNYWQGSVKIQLAQPVSSHKNDYFHLSLEDILSVASTNVNGEIEYEETGKKQPLELLRVIDGAAGIHTLNHMDGMFIDYNALQDGSFEILLRSSIPITEDNQVTDYMFTNIVSIPEEHFDYHVGISNILGANESIFSEPALLSSNIKDGLGLFSGCVNRHQTVVLTK